jgi:hypothetical protein
MSVTRSRTHPRHQLLLIALVFFGPLLLAFWMYYGSSWRPVGRINHGDLIAPPRPLPALALARVEGSGVATASISGSSAFRGKWSLVYLGPGDCGAGCRKTLYFMRQTHLGLGRLMPRVQRVFLVSRDCCDRALIEHDYPDLIVLDAQGRAAEPLLRQFPAAPSTSIFIVDPRGNLMMRYDANADPKGLRDDLKRLLDLSHIG